MSRTYYINRFLYVGESGFTYSRQPYFKLPTVIVTFSNALYFEKAPTLQDNVAIYINLWAYDLINDVYLDYNQTYDLSDDKFKTLVLDVDGTTYLGINNFDVATGASEPCTNCKMTEWSNAGWSPENYNTFQSNCITWCENNLPSSWTSVNLVLFLGDYENTANKIHVPLIYEGNNPNADEILII